MKALIRLNKYFARYKFYLILGTVFVTVSVLFSVIPAQLVRQSIDLIVNNYDLNILSAEMNIQHEVIRNFEQSIIYFAVLILAMACFRGFFLYLTRQTIIVMSRHIEFDMKNDIYKHYQSLPLKFYRSNNTGDLITRISEDVGHVRMYIGPAVMYGINLIVLFIVVICQMLSVNTTLTLYTLLPLPVLSISIYYVSNKLNKQSEAIQSKLSNLSTFVQESFSGIRVLKAFVREKDASKKYFDKSDLYKNASLKLSMINSLFFPLILSLIGLSTVLVVYVGGLQVLSGNISVGNIAEFVIYINMLTWPVTSVGWVTSIIQRAAASQKRINEFLDIKTDIISKQNLQPEIKGSIEFKNVDLVYPDSGITAIRNLNLSIKAGETVAIVGNTGSGKSSLANLICRMYDPTSGTIYIDNNSLDTYHIQYLRSQIGYVPQDAFLFSDSIKNNISFGKKVASDDDIVQASKDAHVYHNIKDFPNGMETVLGERGITLSGGQKQRITLARALIRQPQILILDDSLSAVDTKTEDEILSNLKRVMENRTSIIISHRVSSIKMADKIVVLENGTIVEQGTHETLLQNEGVYKDLYEMQLEEESQAG